MGLGKISLSGILAIMAIKLFKDFSDHFGLNIKKVCYLLRAVTL